MVKKIKNKKLDYLFDFRFIRVKATPNSMNIKKELPNGIVPSFDSL